LKKPLALASSAVLLTATIIGFFAAGSASAAVMTYHATLLGSNEVPPVASTYTGMATITIDPDTDQVCVTATLNNPENDPVILDHIHMGAEGVPGGVVINFNNNLDTCVAGDPNVVDAVVANPAGYYFNVHTTMFQGGAARGQLVLQAAATTAAPAPTTTVAAQAVVVDPNLTG
jgi:hypothetical protein